MRQTKFHYAAIGSTAIWSAISFVAAVQCVHQANTLGDSAKSVVHAARATLVFILFTCLFSIAVLGLSLFKRGLPIIADMAVMVCLLIMGYLSVIMFTLRRGNIFGDGTNNMGHATMVVSIMLLVILTLTFLYEGFLILKNGWYDSDALRMSLVQLDEDDTVHDTEAYPTQREAYPDETQRYPDETQHYPDETQRPAQHASQA